MLRELITHSHKAAETTYTAAADMSTGMGVVKNVDGTCSFPSEVTGVNLYLVDKERIPTGINAGRVNLSDYEPEFNTVAQGDKVKLPHYGAGEKFATSEFTDLTDDMKGQMVGVGSDGKWVVATGDSIYRFEGIYKDAGVHDLAKILVLDFPVANA